ncbi:MAG: hypothetical protein QXY21_00910 [Candidatus Micrarchaeaceae archaeon]
MEYNSAQSEHLPSESFERWFTAPLLENLKHVDPIQQRFCIAFRTLGFYAGQAASYSMPISKQNILFNFFMQQQKFIYARNFSICTSMRAFCKAIK